MSTVAFAMVQGARHSQRSRNLFHAGHGFPGYSGLQLLRPVKLLVPWRDLTVKRLGDRELLLPDFRQVRSPLPSLDITTTAIRLLGWDLFCQGFSRAANFPFISLLFDLKASFFVTIRSTLARPPGWTVPSTTARLVRSRDVDQGKPAYGASIEVAIPSDGFLWVQQVCEEEQ